MNQDELIKNSRNIVWESTLGVGRNNPISLHTKESSMYRVTGFAQIKDIIYSGYVKPKEGKINGGNYGVVYWSRGGDKLFFYDKRPVVEADFLKRDKGVLTFDDLLAIWIFDSGLNHYENRIDLVRQLRAFLMDKDVSLDKEFIASILSNGDFTFEDKQEIIEMCRQNLSSSMNSLIDLKDSLDIEESSKIDK